MLDWSEKIFAVYDLGDRRLSERAMSISKALSEIFSTISKALSEIFSRETVLKRGSATYPAKPLPITKSDNQPKKFILGWGMGIF
ncbi:hypothetical protein KBT16_01595 [Nostoc sp. CCCryo 231-06]|nr:hypothetical protein [Nostoc sp. CCCryo 231-06]